MKNRSHRAGKGIVMGDLTPAVAAGDPSAVSHRARMLVVSHRPDEALDVLRPNAADPRLTEQAVDLLVEQGHVGEALKLLSVAEADSVHRNLIRIKKINIMGAQGRVDELR